MWLFDCSHCACFLVIESKLKLNVYCLLNSSFLDKVDKVLCGHLEDVTLLCYVLKALQKSGQAKDFFLWLLKNCCVCNDAVFSANECLLSLHALGTTASRTAPSSNPDLRRLEEGMTPRQARCPYLRS